MRKFLWIKKEIIVLKGYRKCTKIFKDAIKNYFAKVESRGFI